MVERLAYDPWGKRRNIQSQPGQPAPLDQLVGQHTERGYTEHEHLDEVGVIHMNGRIFDPFTGYFSWNVGGPNDKPPGTSYSLPSRFAVLTPLAPSIHLTASMPSSSARSSPLHEGQFNERPGWVLSASSAQDPVRLADIVARAI